jgi:uncharacterized protein (DUF2344 family)
MPTREEIKAEIMSKLEKLVDETLESGKKPLTMTQIEDLALGMGGKMEEEITSVLVEQQTTPVKSDIPTCRTCGGRMHRKGNKKRYLRSRSGDIEMERPYFYCKTCQKGLFPPR